MKVHYLQHVAFEGIAAIGDWADARGHAVSGTELFRYTPGDEAASDFAQTLGFPSLDDIGLLVVMGGPMNVHDTEKYPWLEIEKAFIQAAIAGDKAVLGICLGAQLVADVMGGPVTKNLYAEVGWYPVGLTGVGREDPLFAGFPDAFTALHWHGDTFAIPQGATHAASSLACTNQAFTAMDGRVVGLQFHLEETPESLGALVEYAAGELEAKKGETWVATAEDLLSPSAPYEACRGLLFTLLDRMAAKAGA